MAIWWPAVSGIFIPKNIRISLSFLKLTINNVLNVFGIFCCFQCLFYVFWFPQVVQKHMLGEIGIWMTVWWPVVFGIFVLKIIKICTFFFKLQLTNFGVFFMPHSVDWLTRLEGLVGHWMWNSLQALLVSWYVVGIGHYTVIASCCLTT